MKLSEIIFSGRERLRSAKLECHDPLLHMVQIVAFALQVPPAGVYLRWEDEVGEHEAKIEALLSRRLQAEPFQYLVGYEWFWDSKFIVGPGVLIPRRETEHVVECCLEKLPSRSLRIAELGAGSGNIGVSLLLERPTWQWYGYEQSAQAFSYLERNRENLLESQSTRYHPRLGDFFSMAVKEAPFDAIVSNPPYVVHGEISRLSREVSHEPVAALDGGSRGMDVIERLASEAKAWVAPGGFLIVEIGYDQRDLAKNCFLDQGWIDIECRNDYAGLPRVVLGKRPA